MFVKYVLRMRASSELSFILSFSLNSVFSLFQVIPNCYGRLEILTDFNVIPKLKSQHELKIYLVSANHLMAAIYRSSQKQDQTCEAVKMKNNNIKEITSRDFRRRYSRI